MAHAKPNHPYHLVNPSPWPFLGSIAGLVFTGGLVLLMHDITVWVMPIGVPRPTS